MSGTWTEGPGGYEFGAVSEVPHVSSEDFPRGKSSAPFGLFTRILRGYKKMLDKDGIPIPVTSNNWSPIERFKPEFYPDHADFLIWLVNEEGNGFLNVAQYAPKDMAAYIANPDGEHARHITGEWRHVEGGGDLEPIAFRPMLEGPDLNRLKEIVSVYGEAA